jgi:hypothetical protein
MADTLESLRSAGFQVDKLADEQKQVLANLSDDEAGVLTSIKSRLDEAGSDVEGYVRSDDGYVFW